MSLAEKNGKVAFVCGCVICGLAAAALTGWLIGYLPLAGFRSEYIPMAPSTAVALFVFGGLTAALGRGALSRAQRILGILIIAAVLFMILSILARVVIEFGFSFESIFIRTPKRIGPAPIGRMSPITAASLFLAGISLAGLLRHRPPYRLIAAAGTGLAFAGLIILLGYVNGVPLLYGGKIIPVAATTAVGLVVLGVGLIFLGGNRVWPLAVLTGGSARARILRVFLPLTMSVVIIGGALHAHVRTLGLNSLLVSVGIAVTAVAVGVAASVLAKSVGAAVEAAETLLERTFSNLQEAVFVISLSDLTVKACNPAAERIFGYNRVEMLGRTTESLYADRKDHEDLSRWLASGPGGRAVYNTEFEMKRSDGTVFPAEQSVSAITEGDSTTAFIIVVRDITARRLREAKIAYITYHDPLTGLPNRKLFSERLDAAIAVSKTGRRQLAVIHIDLDDFKHVNEIYGRDFGDLLILSLVERIKTVLRGGELFGRIGVDEFGVGLFRIDQVKDVADKCRELLGAFTKAPFFDGEKKVSVSAAAGVSLFPSDSDNAASLLSDAEVAMRQAKRRGRNAFDFYTPGLHRQLNVRLDLESSFIQALEQGEFIPYYQPSVDIHTGLIEGAEALARWAHPKKGLLMPDAFIPLAEETGLISPMGEAILRASCRQAVDWQKAGFRPLFVSVNVSAVQIWEKDFPRKVERVLAKTGLEPHHLELELTETAIMSDVRKTVKTMTALKAVGVLLAIDDFGTGYSSLSMLTRFPIDTLKIDRAFIRDMTDDDDAKVIVEAIVSMARTLKLSVVAEGVETSNQLEILRSLGGDTVQGYLLSPPVPPLEFEGLLRHGRLLRRVA